VLLAALAAAPLLGLAALARSHGHSRAEFAFCNQSEIGSLDPAIATGSAEGRLLGALFEGLTRPDPAGGPPLPGVAHTWESSPDGLTWRFHLRPDARWSDGSSVSADDFVFSWLRLLAPATAARYAYLLWCVEGAREYSETALEQLPDASDVGITAVGPHELLLRLSRPCPYLPLLTSYHPLAPVQRSCLERHGTAWIKPGLLVGNGSFRLAERRIRDRIRLARSDSYWGVDEVALATIDVFAVEASTTQLNMYLTGLVDWMVKPPPALYDELLSRPDAHTGPQLGTSFLRFNTRRTPLDDPRVRRALALALDREALARNVLRGGESAVDSLVPPGLPGYEPASLGPSDPDRARQLLAEAGHPGGVGLPPLELLYPHNAATADFCAAVADTWQRELGVELRLVNQAFEVYLDSTVSGRYDVAWGTWIGDYLDPSTFLEVFLSGSGNNRTGWGDPAYDALLERAVGLADSQARARYFREAEQLLLDAAPIAPLFQRRNIQLVSPRVTGFVDNLLDVHPLRDLGLTGPAR
jgi:oligopeptide transport system substrate-binding protein